MAAISTGGRDDLMQWLQQLCRAAELGMPTGTFAAAGGHLHIVEAYLRAGFTPCETSIAYAAWGGTERHRDVIVFLRDIGCPWDSQACMYASYAG